MNKLNLGCGRFPKPGFINVDREAGSGIDVIHDLNRYPYPFQNQQMSLIEADHVLEHLDDPFQTMREIHRMLAPGGEAIIRVPHFSRGFTHPEHKRGFSSTFPFYFDPNFQGGYMGVEFEMREMRMNWLAQIYLLKTVVPGPAVWVLLSMHWLFSFCANISPHFCSKLWCFWVGGFDEIVYRFRKPSTTTDL